MTPQWGAAAAKAEIARDLDAHPLTRKLSQFTQLSAEERSAIVAATGKLRDYAPGDDIVRRGDLTGGMKLIVQGFACRYKLLDDGRRQNLAYLIPGDFCDLNLFLLDRVDHSTAAMTRTKVAIISQSDVLALTEHFPNLTRALWRSTLLDEAITREWVVNLGQRTAYERMAHLFCELFYRMRSIGGVTGSSYPLPITQAALGETLGLSNVHVNRTIQELRAQGLISFKGGTVTVNDLPALERVGFFTADYLHLGDGPK
ncbi:Crp/Fnr family transcriptional regulator [Mesorhizobium sp. BAC0120]|uniref:Crp/Fnr family transcriptional regulator n=1 Tax=Mesorhizobium sp. BAC0120 TaxID=3090670 RepID=UPI00298BD8B8|nr:Crp/Fnr family transcriptional regulator [Mesorhizobium sp. BAC0120]MDW6020195.1 Crp/Fnr family transcriptional regulator [Mesorhizobium sp. BAC0120]